MSSGHTQDTHKIESDGYRWFFGMGLLAVVFCLVLKAADDGLSTSTRDKVLGQTLHELRGAQASLPGRVTDTRQTLPFMHQNASDATSAEDHH
ncbi:MAG: hypothetical protein K1X79_02970 [Oligoflexia bacterium]|nr:hypothetical protein [Oligoflexia bacterium]